MNKLLCLIILFSIVGCKKDISASNPNSVIDTIRLATDSVKVIEKKSISASDIQLKKDFQFDKYTLEDQYPYKDTTRVFQWEKIKEQLAFVENHLEDQITYGVLQNYKNMNREAPTVKNFVRNAYGRVSDSLGVERYQSVPLYVDPSANTPLIYGRDGALVKIIGKDSLGNIQLKGVSFEGQWYTQKRYVKEIGSAIKFDHVVVVDVTNQNIATLEKIDNTWYVRSTNPATTGVHNPPYAQETPTGIFLIQENKPKMYYYKDGTTEIHGYAPWASRFTNGAYIHGVPTNNPEASIIEYSQTLGSIPRSHMCVRNASSHAKFIYDRFKPLASLVIVIN